MSRQIILRNPTSLHRRQPFLHSRSSSSFGFDGGINGASRSSSSARKSAQFGEICGGTTAECAAICCCCPCGIANLLVLAIYKVPAGLCRRALRQKRLRKLQKKGLLQQNHHQGHCGCDIDSEFQIHPMVCLEDYFPDTETSEEADKAALELEKQMWERFYGTGFWRSPSQREGKSPRIKQL